MPPKLTDYWDERTRAIDRMAKRVAGLDAEGRVSFLNEIRAAVSQHVHALTDEWLVSAATPIADDLYKAACSTDRWDEALSDYLDASAGTFWALFAKRGFVCHYLVNNVWEDLGRPLEVFPLWFKAAGLVYVFPQAIACHLMRDSGKTSPFSEGMPAYIEEARALANQLVARLLDTGRSFFLLATDPDERTLKAALDAGGNPHVLTICRDEAPAPGSKVHVRMPIEFAAR